MYEDIRTDGMRWCCISCGMSKMNLDKAKAERSKKFLLCSTGVGTDGQLLVLEFVEKINPVRNVRYGTDVVQ